MSSVTSVPGCVAATRLRSSFGSPTCVPLKAVITSSRWRPARSAALPFCTELTMTPFASFSPRLCAMSSVTCWTTTPSWPRRTRPFAMSCSVTLRVMFEGMAKPMPTLPPVGE
jgi:hypothetical protein